MHFSFLNLISIQKRLQHISVVSFEAVINVIH